MCTVFGANVENFFSRRTISPGAFKFPLPGAKARYRHVVLIAGGLNSLANSLI
jgi:hypothetical protein